MIFELTLAAGLTLAADVPLSYKDTPHTTQSHAPTRQRHIRQARQRPKVSIPPVPDTNILDRMKLGIHPFVIIDGVERPLPMTEEELRKYNIESGSTISPELGGLIVNDKLKRLEEDD
jgi:hypothetical protein